MKPDWKNIDTVFLDMDGTLLDLHFDNHFWLEYVPQKYAQKYHLTLEQSKETLFDKYKSMEGKLEWYCIDYWSKRLDLDILALKTECKDRVSIRPGVEDFLIFLQQQGKTVILATNAHPNTLHLKLEVSLLHQHFDYLFSAHDLGYPKESPEFWRTLQNRQPFKPQKSLFIDDNLDILQIASDYGIAYCLGIALPDSQGQVKSSDKFTIVQHFSDLY